jgi:hypothetical protein
MVSFCSYLVSKLQNLPSVRRIPIKVWYLAYHNAIAAFRCKTTTKSKYACYSSWISDTGKFINFDSELFISGDIIREKSQENHETGMEDTFFN